MRRRPALVLLPLLVGAVLLMHGLDAGAHAAHDTPVAHHDVADAGHAEHGVPRGAASAPVDHERPLSGTLVQLGSLCLAVLVGAATVAGARRLASILRSRPAPAMAHVVPSSAARLGWPPWPASSSQAGLCVLRC